MKEVVAFEQAFNSIVATGSGVAALETQRRGTSPISERQTQTPFAVTKGMLRYRLPAHAPACVVHTLLEGRAKAAAALK